uniref:Uncharacterized protein n=1 Tax=Rhizophora mucronata TaxID=61149 RepID=A0A2P2ISQ8_RHIMU
MLEARASIGKASIISPKEHRDSQYRHAAVFTAFHRRKNLLQYHSNPSSVISSVPS